MKLLYIADGRSPTARNWIGHFIQAGYEVHLASTYPCLPVDGCASQLVLPGVVSSAYSSSQGGKTRWVRRLLPVRARTRLRQLLTPLALPRASRAAWEMVMRVKPDLVHAMRIPFEGMLAAMHPVPMIDFDKTPLLISVWGNDFTLHARSSRVMADYTRQALLRGDALHTDCQRDLKLAVELGFDDHKPAIVLPGGGGVKLDVFYPSSKVSGNPPGGSTAPTIINPRGFRAYVRNDTFFEAIPLVLKHYPEACFICPGMAGETQAERWVEQLGLVDKVSLLPPQTQVGMADLYRLADISLSITTHDGTPNTLLEAMACGCFPIAGDVESLHEWITPGVNGWLVDPGDPQALAEMIIQAISNPGLRWEAAEKNLDLVKQRGEYHRCMAAAEEFYHAVVSKAESRQTGNEDRAIRPD